MRGYVLCADDDREKLDTYEKVLGNYGLVTKPVAQLEQVEQTFKEEDFDCIHMDINFDKNDDSPNYNKPNGLSEIKKLLRGRTDIPVLVISAYITNKARQMAEKYGISNAIYGWYHKSDDVDLIALDSIKAIKDRKFRGKYEFKLNPHLLLNKLENISLDIIRKLQAENVSFLDTQENNLFNELELLKKISTNHLRDYFFPVSANHFTLANYYVETLSQAEPEQFPSIDAFSSMFDILEKLYQEEVTGEELEESKQIIENLFRIQLNKKPRREPIPPPQAQGNDAIMLDISFPVNEEELNIIAEVQKEYPQVSLLPVPTFENFPSFPQEITGRGVKIINRFLNPVNREKLKQHIAGVLNRQEKKKLEQVRIQIEMALLEDPSPPSIQTVMKQIRSTFGFDLLKRVIKDMEVNSKTTQNNEDLIAYLNFMAYNEIKEQLEESYPGQYAAFLDGELVGHYTDSDDLLAEVHKEHGRTDIFVTKIGEVQKVVKFRRPRRIISRMPGEK